MHHPRAPDIQVRPACRCGHAPMSHKHHQDTRCWAILQRPIHPAMPTSVIQSYVYLCKLQLAAAVGPARAGRQRRMAGVGGVRGGLLVLLRLLVLRVQQLWLRIVLLRGGGRLLIVRVAAIATAQLLVKPHQVIALGDVHCPVCWEV